MDSAFIHQAANELVQNAGTRNIKQIARSCSLDIRNRGLYHHNCFRVILNHQLDNRFNRRSIKEIFLAVIVSALKFVRRSCSTVAYKAHLLPYVATYPLFRA